MFLPNSLMRTILWISLLAFCQSPSLAAEDQQQTRKQVRFLFLQTHKQTPSTIYIQTKKGIEPLLISSRSPGQYYDIGADGKILIGTVDKDEQNEDVIRPLASVQLSKEFSKTLLLAIPSKNSQYSLTPINENDFKGGSVFFLNNTNSDVGAFINKKRIKIKSKSTAIFDPGTKDESKNTYAAFYMLDGNKNSKLITESTWNISPNRGEICVFYNDSFRDSINFKVFSSYYKKEAEEEE